jgi:hypothetical protein
MAKAMNPPGASCGGGATVNDQLNCICDTDAAGNAVSGTCEPVGWESSQGGGYGGTYCTKSESGAAGMAGTAWVQKCYTRNSQGNLYSVYGSKGMPYTVGGQPAQRGLTTMSGADPQWNTYLNQSQPGALSRFMQKNREMPWYTNTFGTRKSQMSMQDYEELTDEEKESTGLVGWFKSVFGAEDDELLGPGGEEQPVVTEITGKVVEPEASKLPMYAVGVGALGLVALKIKGMI